MDNSLNFREFYLNKQTDSEIINLYYQHPDVSIREISARSGRSIGEIYRIVHKFGSPNRFHSNKHNVLAFAGSGLPVPRIAELTGYSSRNVRYILKNEGK